MLTIKSKAPIKKEIDYNVLSENYNKVDFNNFDFNSWLRECDVIVPVITNREWNKILDIWDYYQIK